MSDGFRRRHLRHAFTSAVLFAALICFAGIFQHGLWTPDEPREAEIGREMLVSGWSAVPCLGGEPFLEKPPLFPWLIALSYRLFGVSAGAARVPAALFSVGSMLIAFALGRRTGGRLAGFFSALVLGTLVKFAEVSHMSVNDTALTFFVAAGHLGLLVARDRHRSGARSPALIAAGACAGLAFMTKGLVGPVLLVGPALLCCALMKEWSFLGFALPRVGAWTALFVSVTGLPWLHSLSDRGGWPMVRSYLVDSTVGRSLAGRVAAFGHRHGPLYYLGAAPVELLPWSLALPAFLASGVWRKTWHGGRTRFLGGIVAAGLVLLTIPATKRGLYVLPLYPAAAALAGVWLSRAGTRLGSRFDPVSLGAIRALAGALLVAAGVLVLASPVFTATGSGGAGAGMSAAMAILREHRTPWQWRTVAAVALATGTAILWSVPPSRRRSMPRAVTATSLAVVATFLVWFAALQPFVDPLKDMGPGTRTLVDLIPRGEPLLGLALDETTRAIVPFYTGRLIRSVDAPGAALAALAAGPSRHLVVMESGPDRLDDARRDRLRLVATEQIAVRRRLSLYAWTQPY